MTRRVALVTGASSGIGWETVRGLARRGWFTVITARRKNRLEELTHLVHRETGMTPARIEADLSQPGEATRLVDETVRREGRLDVLVNNAGVLRMAPFSAMPTDEMRMIFETNFWAVVETIRAAQPHMQKQGGGHIVQVGSGVSRRGLPYMAAYAASKFALLGYTESLRIELAPQNISFSLVLPGGVETEMPNHLDRTRLPPTYPSGERHRISAERAARAVIRAVETKGLEFHVPWWNRPGLWLSAFWPGLVDRLLIRRYHRAPH